MCFSNIYSLLCLYYEVFLGCQSLNILEYLLSCFIRELIFCVLMILVGYWHSLISLWLIECLLFLILYLYNLLLLEKLTPVLSFLNCTPVYGLIIFYFLSYLNLVLFSSFYLLLCSFITSFLS
jgi:hypothetical protein